MTETQIEALVSQIKNFLPQCGSVEEAAKRVVRDLNALGVFQANMIELVEQATARIVMSLQPVEVLQKHSIFQPHPNWYTGSGARAKHWPALRGYLSETKGWGEEAAKKIDISSDEVVSLLADPNKHKFQYRGLVVGYVQSGKTANMTAVIAKAIDEGYNMVIVLAGLTNKLRQQTQRRMEADLVNRYPHDWLKWTNSEDDGDFRMPMNEAFTMPTDQQTQLCVLKKNVSPLGHFIQTLERTPAATLRKLRVLLIDDECDSASVNSASNELDITAINERIRQIIGLIPAVSYVGYTATPFANVLINPYPPNSQELDDLYPRNFITSLEQPDGYFGAEQLFGREPINADDLQANEEGLDMIRNISEEELPYLQPARRDEKDAFHPQMVPSLVDAVLYFLAACAARMVRGNGGEHMTMLVHTSVYTILHDRLSALIAAWLELHDAQLRTATGEIGERLRLIWEREFQRLPSEITQEKPVSFELLAGFIGDVLDRMETPVENSLADDRLDYENGPKIYIVVGGTVLSRGLTLEGLMVSYFLRSTNQYDTLLQMGRWFGYRRGYEDLPRLWMTAELRTSFRMLALVEAEIRADIKEFSDRDVTPMAFAVRIRTIPGMAITAASKMRHARVCDISYSGQHVQTIRFDHKDQGIVSANWQAGGELLSSAERLGSGANIDGKVLFTGVPVTLISRFLQNYCVHKDHRELSGELLLKYIGDVREAFPTWNIGLHQPRSGHQSEKALGVIGHCRLSNRAMLDDQKPHMADIKALMSRKDVAFDCANSPPPEIASDWSLLKQWRQEQIGTVPLLLLYAIDGDSSPQHPTRTRTSLDAVGDILGFGIVFPGSDAGAGGYVRVNLEAPSGDEIESLDDEIKEREEVGDVI